MVLSCCTVPAGRIRLSTHNFCTMSRSVETGREKTRVRQEFETNKELSEKSRELLRQIISEAKVSGMTQTEFFDLCKRIYKG